MKSCVRIVIWLGLIVGGASGHAAVQAAWRRFCLSCLGNDGFDKRLKGAAEWEWEQSDRTPTV